MSVNKKLFIVNTAIIIILAIFSVMTTTFLANRIIENELQNRLVDIVTRNAISISKLDGAMPENFDYSINDVNLSIYYSDGTLKNGSLPGELNDAIHKGIIKKNNINNVSYYVYDYEILLVGRSSIYLRGVVRCGNQTLATVLIVSASVIIAISLMAIIISALLCLNAVKPLNKMRDTVKETTSSGDLSKRIFIKTKDKTLKALCDEYNFLLQTLELHFQNQERFISDVSHELRTPLTIILAESEYALDEANSVDEEKASLLTIKRQTKRLTDIINQLLDFSRFVNTVNVELSLVNASEIVTDMAETFIGDKNISCHFDVDDSLVVLAEETLFVRTLQNLIDNSVKYGKENGNVFLSLKKEGEYVVLSVKDDGIGMSAETISHAFDRFYQADKSRSNKGGLGLGLSFVKEIVRLFNAKLTIDSEQGEGTEIKIWFNCVKK